MQSTHTSPQVISLVLFLVGAGHHKGEMQKGQGTSCLAPTDERSSTWKVPTSDPEFGVHSEGLGVSWGGVPCSRFGYH